MKISSREKYIIYFCVALFMIMLLEKAIFSPLGRRLDGLNQEMEGLETKLIKGLRQEAQREQILKSYKNAEGYLKLKGSDEEVVSEFLREIEKLARESGVSLSDVKPRTVNKREIHKEYLIDIRTEAALEDIITFLYRMNNSKMLLKVDKLILSLKEENADILRAIMMISGAVLF